MRTRVALSLLLCPFLVVPDVVAQQLDEVEDLHLQQVEFDEANLSSEEATYFILDRLEDGEQSSLLQAHLLTEVSAGGSVAMVNQDGALNRADVIQIGLSNLAVMHQDGSGNTMLLAQLGDRNVFATWLIGDENQLSVHQEGDDNLYVLDFVGDNLNHSVQQIGNGIDAYQIGAASRPFSIEQYGSGMNIRIEHNSP